MRRSRSMLPLILAGCAMAAPALAQHRPESPLPPSVPSTHVPRLAADPAPTRPTKTKSVFGAAMSLLIANLQAQQAAPVAPADAPAPETATARADLAAFDTLPTEQVALQADDDG